MTPDSRADQLTRTTLQIDGSITAASLAPMIRALQRVPGVLLAEGNAASARALVAHDAAVPSSSLIAAAANVGVQVRIVSDTRSPASGENLRTPNHRRANRQLLIAAAIGFIVVTSVDVLLPNTVQKHWILIALMSALWGFFLAKLLLAKH